MTGMCGIQDRYACGADTQRVFYSPFAPKTKSHAQLIKQFEMAANTGNYLIGEGAYNALSQHSVTYLPFWYCMARIEKNHDEFIQRIRENYDFCLFVTANILNADFDISNEVKFLTEMSMPTIFMSIGVQRRSDLTQQLSDSTCQFIDFLRRGYVHSFTRGSFVAEFLQSKGVQNVYQACCPSAFNHSENIISSLHKLKQSADRNFNEIWINGYLSESQQAINDIQSFSKISNKIGYVFQDEPLLFGALDNLVDAPNIFDDANGHLLARPACDVDLSADNKILDFYSFLSPEQWRARSAAVDIFIGRRFHGNLVGMQSGTPAFFIAHDDRVTEMLSSIGLPFVTPEEWDSSPDKVAFFRDFVRNFDLAKSEDMYFSKRDFFFKTLNSIVG